PRRNFLRKAGNGFGMLALAGLMDHEGLLSTASTASAAQTIDPRDPLAPRGAHFPAKARSVIWLFINGGPSHVDTWDYKPELERLHDRALPGFDQNTGFFTDQVGPLMKSPFRFQQHGQSGSWVSEIFPNIARH